MLGRRCAQVLPIGRPCRAAPMRGARFCFWHNPDTEEEAAEARRLGGIRRRREKAVAAASDFEWLGSADQIRRIVEIVTIDGFALENSVARGRLLLQAGSTAAKLLEERELDVWVMWFNLVEATVGPIDREVEAWRQVEKRYLGGHDCLFPDVAAGWTAVEQQVDILEDMRRRLGPPPGWVPPDEPAAVAPTDDEATTDEPVAGAAETARTLADDARVNAFRLLGQRERGVAIMTRRLRDA